MDEQIKPEQMLNEQQAPANQIPLPATTARQTPSETPNSPKPSLIPKKYFIIMTVLILLLGIAYAAVYFFLNKQLSMITHTKP